MKKTFKGGISATVAVLLAASLLVTGCATKGGSGTSPAPETLAERLAADLNALKAGSATAEDATIQLTGDVNLTARFTVPGGFTLEVPAGVTLDLTADGAEFWLQDGATLTVNGTVNTSGHGDHGSGWVEGGLRLGDGAAVINGSGTINLKSKGCVLNVWGDKKHLTLDGVTLVGIEDNDRSLVEVGGGGEFVLKSGAIMDNTNRGGVQVNENGIFTMKGGTISGNTNTGNGGGVSMWANGASFTMSGGTISNNTAGGPGGGVGTGGDNTSFTMTGGTISGNTTNHGIGGGGLYVGRGCTFNKTGGIIYGDTDNTHTPGSTENTAAKGGEAHAVFLTIPGSSPNQIRKATAGESVNMSWDGTTAVGFDGTSNAG